MESVTLDKGRDRGEKTEKGGAFAFFVRLSVGKAGEAGGQLSGERVDG